MLKDKWTLETLCQVKNACYKRPNITRFHLYELPRTGKSVKIESRLVVAYGMGVWGENNKWLLIGVGFLLYKKNFYWSVADSQCCVSFSGTAQPISYAYIPSFLDSFPIQVIGVSSFFFFNIYLTLQGLSCGMWDLVSWSGIEPRPPALGTWSLSHWTTREIPGVSSWSDKNVLKLLVVMGAHLCKYTKKHQIIP